MPVTNYLTTPPPLQQPSVGFLRFCFFFLRYYLFIWQTEIISRQRGRRGGGEAGSPLSREPNAELHPRTLGSWPEPKAEAFNPLSHPGALRSILYIYTYSSGRGCKKSYKSHTHQRFRDESSQTQEKEIVSKLNDSPKISQLAESRTRTRASTSSATDTVLSKTSKPI